MITEKNTIKTGFSDFKRLQKVLWQKLYICSIAALAVGAAGVLAYIILSTVWETLYGYSPAWCEALLAFAVPFGIGIVFVMTFRSTFKQGEKLSDAANVYEFYSDCFMVRELHGGVETGVARIEYGRIVRVKEKERYLLVRYIGGGAALPIDKTALSEEELNTVKKLLRMQVGQGASVIGLASSADCGAQVAVAEPNGQIKGE